MLKDVVFIDTEDGQDAHFMVPAEQFSLRLPVAGEIVDIDLHPKAGSEIVRFHVAEVRWILRAGKAGSEDGALVDVHVRVRREKR